MTLDSDALTQRLEVTNTGGDSLKLTAAFHTYFSVGAIAQTKVQRLFRRQPSCLIWSGTCHSPVLSEDMRMLSQACTACGMCYPAGAVAKEPFKATMSLQRLMDVACAACEQGQLSWCILRACSVSLALFKKLLWCWRCKDWRASSTRTTCSSARSVRAVTLQFRWTARWTGSICRRLASCRWAGLHWNGTLEAPTGVNLANLASA